MSEVEALKKIKFHKHIIEMYESGITNYQKTSGKNPEVEYIALEVADGGQLLDSIAHCGRF